MIKHRMEFAIIKLMILVVLVAVSCLLECNSQELSSAVLTSQGSPSRSDYSVNSNFIGLSMGLEEVLNNMESTLFK